MLDEPESNVEHLRRLLRAWDEALAARDAVALMRITGELESVLPDPGLLAELLEVRILKSARA